MANIIIVLLLAAAVGYGIYSFVHHLRCGGSVAVSMRLPPKKYGWPTATAATTPIGWCWVWTV